MSRSFTSRTKTHNYATRTSQSPLLSPKGTPDRIGRKPIVRKTTKSKTSIQPAPTLSTPTRIDPMASMSQLSSSLSPILSNQVQCNSLSSPLLSRPISNAWFITSNQSTSSPASIAFNSPVSQSPFSSLVDYFYPSNESSSTSSNFRKSNATFASYDTNFPTIRSDIHASTHPLRTTTSSNSYNNHRSTLTTKQSKNTNKVWDTETFNHLWTFFKTQVHTVVHLSISHTSIHTSPIGQQLSAHSQFKELPEKGTDEMKQLGIHSDSLVDNSSNIALTIEVLDNTSNTFTTIDCATTDSTIPAHVKIVRFADNDTIFNCSSTQSSMSQSSQPQIMQSQIKSNVQENSIFEGNDENTSMDSTDTISQFISSTNEKGILADEIEEARSNTTSSLIEDIIQYNLNNPTYLNFSLSDVTASAQKSTLPSLANEYKRYANKIVSLLKQYNDPDRSNTYKKQVAHKLYLQVQEVIYSFYYNLYEDNQIHYSHFHYPSTRFQSSFDIIFQDEILQILYRHLVPAECQILKNLSIIDIHDWIQFVATFEKLNVRQEHLQQTYRSTFEALFQYQLYTFLATSSSTTELQELHSFFVSQFSEVHNFFTNGVSDLLTTALASPLSDRTPIISLRYFINTIDKHRFHD